VGQGKLIEWIGISIASNMVMDYHGTASGRRRLKIDWPIMGRGEGCRWEKGIRFVSSRRLCDRPVGREFQRLFPDRPRRG